MIFESTRTRKLLVLYETIYCPYELPNNAETESQTPSELATVDAGYGGCLSRYLVAGVAFEAPSTCKQLTPQITAICDGAQETTMLYLNTHARSATHVRTMQC